MNIEIRVKRFSLILCLVLFVFCCFSPFLLASSVRSSLSDESYERDIGGWYYLYSPDGFLNCNESLKFTLDYISFPNANLELTPFQAFLAMILYNSSCPQGYITYENIISWENMIVLRMAIDDNSQFIESSSYLMYFLFSADDLMTDVLEMDDKIYIGLTKKTYDVIIEIHRMFYSMLNIEDSYVPLKDFVYLSDFNSLWYESYDLMVMPFVKYYGGTIHAKNWIQVSDIVFVSKYRYESDGAGGDLWSIFSGAMRALDIRSYVSWLPPLIASQYLTMFSLVISLGYVLVALKVIRG